MLGLVEGGVGAAVGLVLVVAGSSCGEDRGLPSAGSDEFRLVADGAVVSWAAAPGTGDMAAAEVRGRVDVGDEGCLTLELDGIVYRLVWPAGSEASGSSAVALPDGDVVVDGSSVGGGGGYSPLDTLPAGSWVELVDDGCAEPISEVAWFNPAEVVEVAAP